MTILFSNNAASALASGISNSATSLTVLSGQGSLFPTITGSNIFYVTLASTSSSAIEIVKVTAISSDTMTIVRAQDGTTASAFNAGDKVELRLPRVVLNDFPQLDGSNTFTNLNSFSNVAITGGTESGVAITNNTIDSTPIGSTTPSTVKATSLTVTGSTSGTLNLAATAVAGTNTATFPAVTGKVMVNANMPTFSAYQSSAQTLTTGSVTKIQFQTEEWDTASCFDNVTNYRFTPNVNGYYQVQAGISGTSANTYWDLRLYKNGTFYRELNNTYASSNTSSTFGGCQILLNGSTDYIEIYASCGSGQALNAVSTGVYFQASMIRSA